MRMMILVGSTSVYLRKGKVWTALTKMKGDSGFKCLKVTDLSKVLIC